ARGRAATDSSRSRATSSSTPAGCGSAAGPGATPPRRDSAEILGPSRSSKNPSPPGRRRPRERAVHPHSPRAHRGPAAPSGKFYQVDSPRDQGYAVGMANEDEAPAKVDSAPPEAKPERADRGSDEKLAERLAERIRSSSTTEPPPDKLTESIR